MQGVFAFSDTAFRSEQDCSSLVVFFSPENPTVHISGSRITFALTFVFLMSDRYREDTQNDNVFFFSYKMNSSYKLQIVSLSLQV